MKPSELLKGAYAILSEGPHRWTKGGLARSAGGNIVSWDDDRAVCFCGFGALIKEAGVGFYEDNETSTYRVVEAAENKLNVVANSDWVSFNDDPLITYEQMLAKYREAIELAEAEEREEA